MADLLDTLLDLNGRVGDALDVGDRTEARRWTEVIETTITMAMAR